MNENVISIIKKMRGRYPNGSVKISNCENALSISVSDGKFTFENTYALNEAQTAEVALNDVVNIFDLDSAEIPVARQRKSRKCSAPPMDIVPLIPYVYEDSSICNEGEPSKTETENEATSESVIQTVENTVDSTEPVVVEAETPVDAETIEPATSSVLPRRRRRASEIFAPDELEGLMINPESIIGKPAETETAVDQPLPNQVTLDEVITQAEQTRNSTPAADEAPTEEPTVTPESSIPPSSAEEDLERALGYVITVGIDSGHTLGELPEIHGKDAAIEKLGWYAYRYRGRDIELKNNAGIVLQALTA